MAWYTEIPGDGVESHADELQRETRPRSRPSEELRELYDSSGGRPFLSSSDYYLIELRDGELRWMSAGNGIMVPCESFRHVTPVGHEPARQYVTGSPDTIIAVPCEKLDRAMQWLVDEHLDLHRVQNMSEPFVEPRHTCGNYSDCSAAETTIETDYGACNASRWLLVCSACGLWREQGAPTKRAAILKHNGRVNDD